MINDSEVWLLEETGNVVGLEAFTKSKNRIGWSSKNLCMGVRGCTYSCKYRDSELHALNPHQQFSDGENFRLYFQDILKLLKNKKINLWWLVLSTSFDSCTGYEETTT